MKQGQDRLFKFFPIDVHFSTSASAKDFLRLSTCWCLQLALRSTAAIHDLSLGGGCSSRSPKFMRSALSQCGGEIQQIQFLLGHASVQTTEKYLGCKQRLRDALNDHIGFEPDA